MNARSTRRTLLPLALGLAVIALAAPPVSAASPTAQAEIRTSPQRSRVACTPVRGDERDNCLSEASTLAASIRPSRADENPEQLARNALRRCEPLSEPGSW